MIVIFIINRRCKGTQESKEKLTQISFCRFQGMQFIVDKKYKLRTFFMLILGHCSTGYGGYSRHALIMHAIWKIYSPNQHARFTRA